MAFGIGKTGMVSLAAILLVAALAVLIITVDVDADEVDGIDIIEDSDDLVEWLMDESESPSYAEIEEGLTLSVNVTMNGHKTLVSGTIKIGSGYILEIPKSSSLTLSAGATIVNEGSLENVGSIITERIVDSEVVSINNYNYFYNDGTVTNYGTIMNYSRIVNYDTIINYGFFTNNGSFKNHDTFTNSSYVTTIPDSPDETILGSVENYGQIENNAVLINANGAEYFKNVDEGTITNNNLMSGIIGGNGVNDLSNGVSRSFESFDYDSNNAVYTATVANPAAVQITGISAPVSNPIAVAIGPMYVSIPSFTVVPGKSILVGMHAGSLLSDNLSRTFEVSVAGLVSGAEVEVTVPLSRAGVLDGVYHTVDGLLKSKMEVVKSTDSDVTFKTDHNSTYTVVQVDSGDRTYGVRFNPGAGYILDTGDRTVGTSGECTFTVRAMDGYEIVNVYASNGSIVRNGYECTLSNVTTDTTVYIMATETVPESVQDETSDYLVIGAAVGVIIVLGLAAVTVLGKKQ